MTPKAILKDIQKTINNCLDEYCLKAKPNKYAQYKWSLKTVQLFIGVRRAKC